MSDDVEIAWLERDVRALDAASCEVVVATLGQDERPPGGVLSLLDWRMCGRLSRRCLSGFLSGAPAERFLTPGRPWTPFDKILILGVGAGVLDETSARDALERMLDALVALEVRRAAIELPGRAGGVVTPTRALELLEAALSSRGSTLESLLVIDDREMARAVEVLRARPARRAREARR